MILSTYTVSVSIVRPVVALLDAEGHDADAFLRALSVSRADVVRGEARIDFARFGRAFEATQALVDDPCFGLSLARRVGTDALGPLGIALAAGGELRHVLAILARFFGLVTDGIELRFGESEAALTVELVERPDAHAHPHAMLLALALIADFVRRRVRGAVPSRVVVRELDESSLRIAARYFRCNVELGSGVRLEFPSSLGSEVLDGTDRAMADLLERNLSARFERPIEPARDAKPITTRLARWLETRLRGDEPSLSDGARALGLTERSLQRRLKAENATWQSIVEEVRRTAARRYLEARETNLTEVSYLLGFSDLSAFSRAFRKWYGVSPSTFRKRLG